MVRPIHHPRPPGWAVRFGLPLILTIGVGRIAATEPVALTQGPGNDTEAVWSPDGARIAFQSDRKGKSALYVLDLASGRVDPLLEGPGYASFPAWSPDGKWIVCCHAHFTRTALEGLDGGYNLLLVPAGGGKPSRLTSGICHDSCPAFSADGKSVWFSSDRGTAKGSNAMSLYRVPVDGREPTLVLRQEGSDRAIVQPTVSADRRWMAFGRINGFRDNWHLRLTPADRIDEGYPLTDSQGSFYGPRFSPAAPVLACTGFQPGDPDWSVYLCDPRSSRRQRVDCGPGNSRSPAWSPDGRELVFENNRTGRYKLYRIKAPAFDSATAMPSDAEPAGGIVLQFSFAQRPGSTVADQSRMKNAGRVVGTPAWGDGAMRFDQPAGSIMIQAPAGFDFGTGPFAVRAAVSAGAECRFGMIATGQYPGNPLGWQLYVTENRRVFFNSRSVDLAYRGACSDEPLPAGRPVTLTGVRDAAGGVRLYVDGLLQRSTCPGADYSYDRPAQVCVGAKHDGSAPFPGAIYEVTVFRRVPTPAEARGDSLERLWAESRRRWPSHNVER